MSGYKKASQWLTKYSSNVSRLGMSTKRIANVIKTFESVQNLQNNLRYSISNGREEDKKSVILNNTAVSSTEPLTREPGESIEDFAKRVTERNKRYSKEARFEQDMQSEEGQKATPAERAQKLASLTLSEDAARREIVADFVGRVLLQDADMVRRMIVPEIKPETKGHWQKVLDRIKEFLNIAKGTEIEEPLNQTYQVLKEAIEYQKNLATNVNDASKYDPKALDISEIGGNDRHNIATEEQIDGLKNERHSVSPIENDEDGHLKAINQKFNSDLGRYISNPKSIKDSYKFQLGKPSGALLYAGFEDFDIEMDKSVMEKPDQDNHIYPIQKLKNLPAMLQHPIAVFDSASDTERIAAGKTLRTGVAKTVLLEATDDKGSNFMVAVDMNFEQKNGSRRYVVNRVKSIYPKDNNFTYVKWFADVADGGKGLCKWADTKKAIQWLEGSGSDSQSGMSDAQRTKIKDSATKVIKSFESVQNLQNNLRYSISNGREEDKKSVILNNTAASSAEPLTREPGESIEDFAKRVTERNKRNEDYLAAVEKGDTKTTERLVQDAAKEAMPETKVVDKNGMPLKVYHGTNHYGFTVFDTSLKRNKWNMGSHFGSEDAAAEFTDEKTRKVITKMGTYSVYLNIKNPWETSDWYFKGDPSVLTEVLKLVNENGTNEVRQMWNELYNMVPHLKKRFSEEDILNNEQGDFNYEMVHEWKDSQHESFYDKVREIVEASGYDGIKYYNGTEGEGGYSWIALHPEQIKSAEAVTYDNNGKVIPLSERFNEEKKDIRYSVSAFYSNAAKAVEDIKQTKGTGEQWLAMLKKNGGLKAEEDKWIGLSEWLKDKKSVTKDEIQKFIAENDVKVEEVHYADIRDVNLNNVYDALDAMQPEWKNAVARAKDEVGDTWRLYVRASEIMSEKYGDKFDSAIDIRDNGTLRIKPGMTKQFAEMVGVEIPATTNATRLKYTTEGLTNKREIALTVPNIESYNESDKVHFGDAGNGRAVAWLRFGDATDADGNKVLVIDEIQSKRHQDGREKGYQGDASKQYKVGEYETKTDKFGEYKEAVVYDADGNRVGTMVADESGYTLDTGSKKLTGKTEAEVINETFDSNNAVPDAPFQKNWHELAMKRALRYAAENGYDKVAWTTGTQQAERYGLGGTVETISSSHRNGHNNCLVTLDLNGGNKISFFVDKSTEIISETVSGGNADVFNGQRLSQVVGSEIAHKLLEGNANLSGNDLSVGGEGMKGFYDQMLPRYMDKYGKKWGVSTHDIKLNLPNEADQVMHAVDVNDAMRESVMQGQPRFSISGKKKEGIWIEDKSEYASLASQLMTKHNNKKATGNVICSNKGDFYLYDYHGYGDFTIKARVYVEGLNSGSIHDFENKYTGKSFRNAESFVRSVQDFADGLAAGNVYTIGLENGLATERDADVVSGTDREWNTAFRGHAPGSEDRSKGYIPVRTGYDGSLRPRIAFVETTDGRIDYPFEGNNERNSISANSISQQVRDLRDEVRNMPVVTDEALKKIQEITRKELTQGGAIVGKRDINAILSRTRQTALAAMFAPKNEALKRRLDSMLEEVRDICVGADLKAETQELIKLLNTQTHGKNQKGVTVAKNVDANTADIMKHILSTFKSYLTVEKDAEIRAKGREIRQAKEELDALRGNGADQADIDAKMAEVAALEAEQNALKAEREQMRADQVNDSRQMIEADQRDMEAQLDEMVRDGITPSREFLNKYDSIPLRMKMIEMREAQIEYEHKSGAIQNLRIYPSPLF